jgi:hypothetical protein
VIGTHRRYLSFDFILLTSFSTFHRDLLLLSTGLLRPIRCFHSFSLSCSYFQAGYVPFERSACLNRVQCASSLPSRLWLWLFRPLGNGGHKNYLNRKCIAQVLCPILTPFNGFSASLRTETFPASAVVQPTSRSQELRCGPPVCLFSLVVVEM